MINKVLLAFWAILLSLVLVIVVGSVFIFTPTSPIDKDYLLDKLEYGLSAHQYYADRPKDCNEFTGDAEWNEEWVEIYEDLIIIVGEYEDEKVTD